jgi:type IV pilus assembly protein PilA
VILIMGILAAIAIPTFLGARTSAQNKAAQTDLRNLLTSESVAYTNYQAYVPGTSSTSSTSSTESLIQLDPAYSKQLTAGTITVAATAAKGSSPAYVCLSEKAASGTYFGIAEVATGSGAGTYYYGNSTTDPTTSCKLDSAGGISGSGWNSSATAAGW